jgi:hypothetical protein
MHLCSGRNALRRYHESFYGEQALHERVLAAVDATGIKLNRTLIGLPARSVQLGESAVKFNERQSSVGQERAARRTAGTSMLHASALSRYLLKLKLREAVRCGQWASDYSSLACAQVSALNG